MKVQARRSEKKNNGHTELQITANGFNDDDMTWGYHKLKYSEYKIKIKFSSKIIYDTVL
jgi:hypothetical protein